MSGPCQVKAASLIPGKPRSMSCISEFGPLEAEQLGFLFFL